MCDPEGASASILPKSPSEIPESPESPTIQEDASQLQEELGVSAKEEEHRPTSSILDYEFSGVLALLFVVYLRVCVGRVCVHARMCVCVCDAIIRK